LWISFLNLLSSALLCCQSRKYGIKLRLWCLRIFINLYFDSHGIHHLWLFIVDIIKWWSIINFELLFSPRLKEYAELHQFDLPAKPLSFHVVSISKHLESHILLSLIRWLVGLSCANVYLNVWRSYAFIRLAVIGTVPHTYYWLGMLMIRTIWRRYC